MQFVFTKYEVENYRNTLKQSCRLLTFTPYKTFFKTKKISRSSPLLHVLPDFRRKLFILLYFITWPYFIVSLLLLYETFTNVYCDCLLTRLWHHKCWNSTFLSNQAVFSTRPKSQHKNLNILRTKRAFRM